MRLRHPFDELVARLCELEVLCQEDLVMLHNLPWRERLPYYLAE